MNKDPQLAQSSVICKVFVCVLHNVHAEVLVCSAEA